MSSLREQWTADPERSSSDKWSDFKREIKRETKDNNARKVGKWRRRPTHIDVCVQMQLVGAMEDIILQFTYPRLDAEVSKHRNHLLKAPFCVHPGTGEHGFIHQHFAHTEPGSGRVCVPVDAARVHEFDPEGVPTVGQLLRELNDAATDGQQHHSGEFVVQ